MCDIRGNVVVFINSNPFKLQGKICCHVDVIIQEKTVTAVSQLPGHYKPILLHEIANFIENIDIAISPYDE